MPKVQGTGSIEKRGNNMWRLRVSLGNDPITGERRRIKKMFRGTKVDAKKALAEWIFEIENGVKATASKTLLMEYTNEWQETCEMLNQVRPATLKNNAGTIRRINKYIGCVLITDLDAPLIKNFYRELSKDGISSYGVRKAPIKLKQILNSAVDDGIIAKNPCNSISVPRPKIQKERESLDKTEAKDLLEVLNEEGDDDPRILAVRIGLATGMRRGEVLGLTWECVDFETNTIRVLKQMTSEGISDTKTASGVRKLSVNESTMHHIAAWKQIQKTYLRSLGLRQGSKSPVISNQVGTFCEPHDFYHVVY